MSLLSDDFFDNWIDWKVELYAAISHFANNPSEEAHDLVVNALNAAGSEVKKLMEYTMPNRSIPVIAVCNPCRKRDALAIMGPIEGSYNNVNTWKCSKHTPAKMRNQWVSRKYSPTGSGLYINRSAKFQNEHTVYIIPHEVYEALCVQFKEM